ncbi:hypothetical protein [Picosynechococcus sp. PCC 7117]|uniref:hypothetical protein n=1 Tax=Picosynechococcus sp. PCC 7117 TaxID=195498 RepID=UPI00081062E2|nr:hypothetical protein [Picosynechococcus sp. PCC 7117]ANV86057.1 hypothetical protein AWQ22_00400 [Picosynechococcus sp. PCC 7117]
MVNPVYQLNQNNWELFYSETKARVVNGEVAFPIEDWEAGLLADAELLAVYCETTEGRDSWRFGGWIRIGFSTGLTVGGIPDAESSQARRMQLNAVKLFPVQKYGSEYSIGFSVPYWLPDITIRVWQYIGPIVYPDYALLQSIDSRV